MSDSPSAWFESLQVDPDDVARVGYGLVDYASDYEAERASTSMQGHESIERQLMLATTLSDAAVLLVLVDGRAARSLFKESATLFEGVDAPDAWTFGLASQGAWRPSPERSGAQGPERPNDGIASLAGLFYEQERERGNPDSSWAFASGFRDNPGSGWTASGVPAQLLNRFVDYASEGDVSRTIGALDQILERADENIRFVQREDSWHWRRFLADVPLVDPELLALAAVAARVDDRIIEELRERPPSPARVALLSGIRIGEEPPRNPIAD